nr:hypothetical protein [Tanacetum cinerariifolium]
MQLYKYFQTAVQKIMGKYLTETDEYVSESGRKSTVDQSSYTIGYRKMKSLVINIRNEIVSDIEMHYKQVLPTDTSIKSGSIYPAIDSALKLYSLLHDIESPEAKMQLYKYFQTAVQKIMGKYLTETDEYVSESGRKSTVDQSSYTIGYRKIKSLVINIRNEIVSDIQMHYKQVLPTPVNDGFDAKALFNMYITKRINDKRLKLLESCKLYKLRLRNDGQQYSAPILSDYKHFTETSDEFRIVISCLPEYYMPLDKVLSNTKGVWNKILEKHTRRGYTYWTKLKKVGNRLGCNAK